MLIVQRETPDQPEVLTLLAEADKRSASLYPAESRHGLDVAALLAAEVRFFMARPRQAGRALGCGGYVLLPEQTAEMKRLFVDPAARGRGVGDAVKDGSTLTVNGDTTTGFNAGASVIRGGNVVIGAPLAGTGTITMDNGAVVSSSGDADAGTLELARRVGAGVTIDIRMGTLLLDKPQLFEGTIGLRASQGSDSHGPQSVVLRGLTASSFSFDDAAHRMTLWSGDTVLDTFQFMEDMVSDSFKTGPYASVNVLQTTDGVMLRGLYATSPAGAVELPRH